MEEIALGRHQLPPYYIENGSIYVLKRSVLFSQGLYGLRVVPFVMGELESVDIDEPFDLAWGEFLMSRGSDPHTATEG
jgi:CMP-N-acetylneuraminic acid synthetase